MTEELADKINCYVLANKKETEALDTKSHGAYSNTSSLNSRLSPVISSEEFSQSVSESDSERISATSHSLISPKLAQKDEKSAKD